PVFCSAGSAESVVTRSTGWLTSPPRFWLGPRSAPCRAARLAALAGAAVTGSYPSGTRESGSGDVTFAGLKIPTSFGLAMLPVQLLLVGACAVSARYWLSALSIEAAAMPPAVQTDSGLCTGTGTIGPLPAPWNLTGPILQ